MTESVAEFESETFEGFIEEMRAGLEHGLKEYGADKNLEQNMITEMKAEIRDQACYAFFMYRKLVKLEQGLLKLKDLKELE